MKHFANIIAQALSLLLYPLWIPTLGISLFCWAFHYQQMPLPVVYWWVAIGGTFLMTALIPLSLILVAIRRGQVSDFQIENASERTMPYVYTSIAYAFWVYFLLQVLHAPFFLTLVGIGVMFAIIGVACINCRWKISAHLTGWGGLTGGILAYFSYYHLMPNLGFIMAILAIALLLMYARLWLNAHTDWQVIAGFGWGLIMTSVPTLIYILCSKS